MDLSLPEVNRLLAAANAARWRDDGPDLDRFEGAEYRRILVPVFYPGPGEHSAATFKRHPSSP